MNRAVHRNKIVVWAMFCDGLEPIFPNLGLDWLGWA